MTADLPALIARLEKATGPDRELDFHIERTLHAPDSLVAVNLRLHDDLPRYTASLDAALTLVPEGWDWECGHSRHVPHNASVHRRGGYGGYVGECDSTRAIALCIAALKARTP